ncbi:MAG: hypothetical protein KGS48_11735 [Bacteroidetes bacterium]|nr:hypothetical protein [Bacteroidota bacterium]
MIRREIEKVILENLTYFPITGIIGPRQVGKTTLARFITARLGRPYVHLE